MKDRETSELRVGEREKEGEGGSEKWEKWELYLSLKKWIKSLAMQF